MKIIPDENLPPNTYYLINTSNTTQWFGNTIDTAAEKLTPQMLIEAREKIFSNMGIPEGAKISNETWLNVRVEEICVLGRF